jgi:SAM-dependent methyltransferase
VGFYRRVVFPWLCDVFLATPEVARHRGELLARAHGEVLEVGFGTGLNLPHYPEHVRRITAVDPNMGMHRRAARRLRSNRLAVERRSLRGEELPFGDGAFDCAVCTFTLCSIDGVERALGEMYRVLRRGGTFLFLEHGLSPDPGVRRWQRRLNRLQGWLADGCRLDRNVRELVAALPFHSVEAEEFYLDRAPRTHGYLYRGVATR